LRPGKQCPKEITIDVPELASSLKNYGLKIS
jgi:hypothetical protein